jgi:hypothetical protein
LSWDRAQSKKAGEVTWLHNKRLVAKAAVTLGSINIVTENLTVDLFAGTNNKNVTILENE